MPSSLTIILAALATTIMATPTPPKSGSGACSASGSGTQACCNGGILSGCLVQAIGSPCSNSAYCCNGGGSIGGLINVDLANCVALG